MLALGAPPSSSSPPQQQQQQQQSAVAANDSAISAPVKTATVYEHAGLTYQTLLRAQLVAEHGEAALDREKQKRKAQQAAADAKPEKKLSKNQLKRLRKKQKALAKQRGEQEAEYDDSKDMDALPPREWDDFRDREVALDDYYGLLNLSDVGVTATEAEIRAMYKRASLLVHPDKYPQDRRDEGEARFKAMQEALETLTDGNLRYVYDSQLEFDDSLPGPDEGVGETEFFRVYRPVFQRNAQFASVPRQQVPQLGDMSTPYEQVDKFYDWWFNFQSWRTFKHEDEHNVEEAASREERRWMERQNARLVADLKKKESARVRRLVEEAFAKDPRVIAHKAKLEEAKNAKKRAKQEAKRKREEAKRKAREAEEERKRKAKAEKQARIKEEKRRKALARRYRDLLRTACRTDKVRGEPYPEEDILMLLEGIKFETLERVFGLLYDTDKRKAGDDNTRSTTDSSDTWHDGVHVDAIAEARKLIDGVIAEIKQRKEEARKKAQEELAARRLKERLEAEERAKRKEWTLEEESALAKAIAKVPGGTRNRWRVITEMVNMVGNRKQKEVIAKAKEFETRKQTKTADHFDIYKKKLAAQRGDDAAASPKQAENGGVAAALAAGSNEPTNLMERHAARHAAQTGTKTGKRKKSKNNKKQQQQQQQKQAEANNNSNSEEWSAQQQAQFEKALKTVPKGSDRWDNIAKAVPGKTKAQCVQRFKHIRAQILARKKAQQQQAAMKAAMNK
eukprot:TRINITY_DN66033_c4_g1_i1.p1 TRINITY_DN66033_c4_g1~~TRINITY_DN66033_c4_g1_i1.p1  ORF type:complete len:736 (-),score=491.07 TRINITY_DN66033_c4_g1_i1:75-2282(-)